MVAHMNAEALQRTIATGEAWYFSRSRRTLWRKGESSGHVQRVVEMRVDCDQDAVWIKVEQEGAGACHTGRRSCFYRAVPLGKSGAVTLEFRDGERTFDPKAVYGQRKSRLGEGASRDIRRAQPVRAFAPRYVTSNHSPPRRARAVAWRVEMRAVVHHAVDADRALAGIAPRRRR